MSKFEDPYRFSRHSNKYKNLLNCQTYTSYFLFREIFLKCKHAGAYYPQKLIDIACKIKFINVETLLNWLL